jgi:two-component system, cell cycle response regulator CpdR
MDRSKDTLIGSAFTPAPLRILYVEDDPLVREITTELLSQAQRHIVAVGSAEQALKEFQADAFDVVITDVSLPAMSGLDLAKRLLALSPQAPIIVASGYILDLSPRVWGPKVRTVLKPFEPSTIDALIIELCAEVAPESTSHRPAPS